MTDRDDNFKEEDGRTPEPVVIQDKIHKTTLRSVASKTFGGRY